MIGLMDGFSNSSQREKKEVIIKSVVNDLLNHVMSCYRLPKTNKKVDKCCVTILVELRGKHKKDALEIMGQLCNKEEERLGLNILWISIRKSLEEGASFFLITDMQPDNYH